MPLDLGSVAKVRDFGSRWETAKYPPIRALVLNAGIQIPRDAEYSNDGVEKHMAINHVGHALLFHLLTPYLTPNARIVVVASGVHDPESTWPIKPSYTTAEQVAHPSKEDEEKVDGRGRYATSKAANIIWTNALARRLEKEGKGMTVVSEDPGLVPGTGKSCSPRRRLSLRRVLIRLLHTDITRDASWIMRFMNTQVMPIMMPILIPVMRLLIHKNINVPKESGAAIAWLAVGEECKAENGKYYELRTMMRSSKQTYDEKLQDDLWDWTVNFVAKDKVEKERFNKIE